MQGPAKKNWCARCQYDGKAEFYAGTFMVRHGAPMSEVEIDALAFLDGMLPTRPRIIALVPGSVWFDLDEDRMAA